MAIEIGDYEEPREQVYIAERERVEWIGRSVEQKELDPRLHFIRQLAFTYLYYLVVDREHLAEFEERLLEELFDNDEDDLETIDPLLLAKNAPILV